MKRILFITPFVPGMTEGGGAAYTYELIKKLSEDNIVDLLYFRYKDKNKYQPVNENVNVIAEYIVNKWQKIASFVSYPFLFPLFTARFRWSIVRKINRLVKEKQYDFCYFDFGQTFSYARFVRHPNKILMAHDVIAQKYTRMKRWLYWWAKRSEGSLLKHGDHVFTFSGKDCKLISDLYSIKSSSTSFFLNKNVKQALPVDFGNYFVMFGSWGREENYMMLEWLLDNEKILLKDNRHVLVVGGGSIPERIRNAINVAENIEYVGFVEDPYPIIANAIAEIAPLKKGAGVKVKCVEALACGTPIIGTEVAFEGINESFSRFMIKAHTNEEYAMAMNTIDFSLEERVAFKKDFCAQYEKNKILSLINTD